MKRFFEGENKILLYYIIMMVPLVLIATPTASYSMIIRMAYFALLIFPLLKNPQFTPFFILAFYGFCDNSCYGFLPDNHFFRYAIVVGMLLNNNKEYKLQFGHFTCYILLYFYILLISIFNGDTNQLFIQNAFLALLLAPFIKNNEDIKRLAIGYCLMSLALAASYYINFSYFAKSYGVGEDFEVGSWQNTNSLGAAIACALPLIIAMLADVIKVKKNTITKILLIASGVFILMTILSTGSRGAFMASSSSSVLILLFSSRLRRKQKIRLLFVATTAVIALYYLGLFELLFYRFTTTDYSGTTASFGGRDDIWELKLRAFFDKGFLSELFGLSRSGATSLGRYVSTHNDYVTALVGFGFIGFVLFLLMFFQPLLRGGTKGKSVILFLMIFVLMECMVLEPLFRGHFHFWQYCVFLTKMADIITRERRYA